MTKNELNVADVQGLALADVKASEKEQVINKIVKTLNFYRGKREVYVESESKRDELSDVERGILQEIADRMGEKIYTCNHWFGSPLYIFTIDDLREDFFGWIDNCKDEEDDYAYCCLNDYVTDFFTVFEPKFEEDRL